MPNSVVAAAFCLDGTHLTEAAHVITEREREREEKPVEKPKPQGRQDR